MTTTYNAPSFTLNKPMPYHGQAATAQHQRDTVTLTAALGLNDGGSIFYLPVNAVIVGGYAKFPTALDTNGSPTLTFDLGVTGTAQLFLAADTTARAGGIQRTFATAAYGYKNTSGAKLAVTWLAHAASATGPTAATFEVMLSYFIEEPTTTGV